MNAPQSPTASVPEHDPEFFARIARTARAHRIEIFAWGDAHEGRTVRADHA